MFDTPKQPKLKILQLGDDCLWCGHNKIYWRDYVKLEGKSYFFRLCRDCFKWQESNQ